MSQNTLADWLAHVERLHPSTIELGLERVHAVRRTLGLAPSFALITVGGTNGKGSTCAFLEAMLVAAGYRVGCYTSPHLLRYTERVRIGGREVDEAALCASFAEVEQARGATSLSYFEFGTLAAMVLFARAGVDAAVLEVGLGGRLDAVNVFDADCAIITSVDIDHVDYLGTTREAIGREKAGIFRGGRTAVCADATPPSSLRAHAASIGANLLEIGRHFDYREAASDWRYQEAGAEALTLPRPALRGDYQLANAAAAITALRALHDRLPVAVEAIRAGLCRAAVAGRFQTLRADPEVIVDVAHNPHAAAALAHNLGTLPAASRTRAVFGMLADKDIEAVVALLRECFDEWLVASIDDARGAHARQLVAALSASGVQVPVRCFDSPASAYRHALNSQCGTGERIVVFGSFHTAAEVLREASALDPAPATCG